MALIHSILMGAVVGMRAIAPSAASVKSASVNGGPLLIGDATRLSTCPSTSAATTVAGDDLASRTVADSPGRAGPTDVVARVLTGLMLGAALAPRKRRSLGAVLASGTAVCTAYWALHQRARAIERDGVSSRGALEDVFSFGSAALIAHDAYRR